jgi:hypothetical protein
MVMQVPLPPRLRAVFPYYFGRRPLPQAQIAALFGVQQPAIAKRVRKIRAAFAAAGLPLPVPGRPTHRLRTQTLSGVWDRGTREYLPAAC